ncbi:hypothetical protein BGP77_02710 [Saccharospirillum sp. MSK14-1]|uniref:hypothetical protein n=1 Tax=Saccharospirillum sp. MSK14-1 TaxID=1897632 RepID=UPI000D3A7531|nr:hypothetical protein [Saccharospirillum sp. MSK14-1]PTY36240.1 hypothetical protein BGP77_02710 [Saccharospirillum sp. MSK14-1]
MRIATAFLLAVMINSALAQTTTTMRLGTNIMPPYTDITDDRQLMGEATATLNCVFDALPDYRYETSIAPWPRVVRLADQGNIDGWFLYVKNASSDRFAELSEPLQLETWYWYSHQPIGNARLEDFRDQSILVLSGTYQKLWLEARGFKQFLTVQSNDSLVRAFLARRADHLLISDSVFDETLSNFNGDLANIERRFVGYIQLGLYVTDSFMVDNPDFMQRFNEAAHACRSTNPLLTENDRQQLVQLAEQLAQWQTSDWMVQALLRQNQAHQWLTTDDIERLDQQWRDELRQGGGELMDAVMESELSIRLAYMQSQQDGVFSEVFVTDRLGLNAGASEPTSDYYQGDEAIFQQLTGRNTRYHIDELEYDESSRTFQVKISVPIRAANGRLLGILVAGVDVEQALRGFK